MDEAPRTGPDGGGGRSFSVVIPVYNGERYLAEAIGSALGQSHPPLEVIVVDDGSTDGTLALARSFGEPVRALTQPNAGPSAARNLGAREARGAWVAFLDGDDRWEPNYLREAGAHLARHPEAGLLCAAVRVLGEDGVPTPYLIRKTTPGPAYSTEGLLAKDVGTIIAPTVRRDLLLAAGGYEETLRGNEDCHLYLRLSLVTELHQLPEPLLLYRRHAGNAGRNLLANARESVRSLELLDRTHPELGARFPRPMAKMRGKEYLRLGRELLVRPAADGGDLAGARRALASAVRWRPGRLRGWLYLAVSYLPGGPAGLARWRRRELAARERVSTSRLAAAFRELKRRVKGRPG